MSKRWGTSVMLSLARWWIQRRNKSAGQTSLFQLDTKLRQTQLNLLLKELHNAHQNFTKSIDHTWNMEENTTITGEIRMDNTIWKNQLLPQTVANLNWITTLALKRHFYSSLRILGTWWWNRSYGLDNYTRYACWRSSKFDGIYANNLTLLTVWYRWRKKRQGAYVLKQGLQSRLYGAYLT